MTKKKKGVNIFFPKLFEWWSLFCLKGDPYPSTLGDILLVRAAKAKVPLEEFIDKYVEIKPIRADSIFLGWLGMGITYWKFSKEAQAYDDIVDFKEYHGERSAFGILREYIVMATGIKYTKKDEAGN